MSFPSLKPHVILFFFVWANSIGLAIAATSTKQFKHWYPRNITKTNCSAEYNKYLTGIKNHSEIDFMAGGGIYTALTQPVVECILKHTSEFLKGSMTGAQILLGVMPTIVALLGPSHDEIAMLSNVGRRPLLAAGIALASPSAYFSRAFEYSDPAKILYHEKNRRVQWRPTKAFPQLLVSFVQYVVVSAACWNVVTNTLQVSLWTINSFSSDTDFMPNVWLGLGLAIHIFSGVVFRLRLRGWRLKPKDGVDVNPVCVDPDVQGGNDKMRFLQSLRRATRSFLYWIKNIGPRTADVLTLTEFVPCAAGGYAVHIRTFKETKIFLFLAWWQSILTILHVVFGTLVFAGMLFVGLQDAMSIVGRYIIPVVVCRVILMYELAGVRESWATMDGEPVPKFGDEAPQLGELGGAEGEKRTEVPKNGGISVSTW
ncbi:hypothetical protein LCI18_002063 [Fusarium solani-melongenae]|uniref:Uncharacterized protein n=1 Tax=Fusarium solani subsp. cucurbitae TaxID=2747967 RepID=A0ACD3YTF0_FUSSC|nr:hypothetical protein LCI18_002063 [Fusarium solani-melongenae]